MSPATAPVVFLFDVDNTLLENDIVTADLRAHLVEAVGAETSARYWQEFEQLRSELGYADYLGALQRCRAIAPDHTRLPQISFFLLDYPFADRLYPRALDVLQRIASAGTTAILTDGDVVFQPHKIRRAGLWDAVEGRVAIYVHKEQMLDAVQVRYPAERYVMIDDKLRILTAMKAVWRERLTTVFVRQGHYATDPQAIAQYPAADVTIEQIGDLVESDLIFPPAR